SQRLLNRELSWLAFNRRVLSLSEEVGIPLLERLKFCAICSANLDEFFQVRVAALKDQVAAGVTQPAYDGSSPQAQLTEIANTADRFVVDQERVLAGLLVELAHYGVELVDWASLDPAEHRPLIEAFEKRMFPVLTPLAVDPAHPFPYISNLALSLAAMISDPDTGERRFARVKVPSVFPRLVALPDGKRFVPVEQIIAAQLHTMFVGMVVEEHAVFRVTRNADLTLEEEEADDLLAKVEMELRRRRFGRAVRLEVQQGISEEMLELLVRELDLEMADVTLHRNALDLTCLFQLHALDLPALKDTPWPPVTAGRILRAEAQDRSIFSVIRERALMVHHPYESFASSVENFIGQAADDPLVQSIKMTLYRAGGDSPIARHLMRAAERGVQVAVLVELKARFDEATNVGWAKALERAGVHVVYGLVGLKTHAKTTLVVRQDDDGLRRYCHIATGNYNSKTARLYEDVGFLTCDPAVGSDVTQLFNHLTGYSRAVEFQSLVVAPRDMRNQLVDLIDHEMSFGTEGRITAKMNSIADPEMVDALYRASQAGVQIDLLVRGLCCLRPGVPGMSENIRVRSILGRYLEHSRIVRFEHGEGDSPLFLIGSADWMGRNLDGRVEVAVPVTHPKHRDWLDQVFEFDLADDIVCHELDEQGLWHRLGPVDFSEGDAQARFNQWVDDRQAL
ncbi:MAG TPA: polyphosphate kinase 1, partial [Ilumatobacteraceae bacterium]|nr:polyphosphate kinase 1 [Ilumatobacteraceae bacterium]